MTDATPKTLNGRGAVSNPANRFGDVERPYDPALAPDERPRLDTVVAPMASKSILSFNTSPDLGFDRTINPYKGCEHGCVYCYARPNHAFLGLSPGLDFESRLFFKPGAAALLEKQLRKPAYTPATVVIGGDTDPYQPIERTHQVTRDVLKVLQRFRHPLAIVTKSSLVARDLDLLADMARDGLAKVAVSVTTLDPKLARDMEPRASTPAKRLGAIRTLADAGVPAGVLAAPMIPGLNDHELEAILEAAADAGATEAGYVVLRLPHELKDLFAEWLDAKRPDTAKKVMNRVRGMRGGRAYDSAWGRRGKGARGDADARPARFRSARRRFGLDGPRIELTNSLFRRPSDPAAPSLFDALEEPRPR